MEDKDFDPFDSEQYDEKTVKQFTSLYDIEAWYDILKECTFETEWFALSVEEAETIVAQTKARYSKDKNLTKEHQKHLENLKSKMDKILKKYSSEGCFIRLSTRSPKDAVINSPKLYHHLKNELPSKSDENLDLIAWYTAAVKAMKVTNGEEALDLLLRSERVFTDLKRWLNFPDEFPMNIIFRKWVFMHPSMEFRGFVYKKKLTAVSQYIDVCYFDNLKCNLDHFKELILDYFKSVKKLVPVDNYVIDFAIINENEVKIIEINPFFIRTGASLYNWLGDKNILLNEDKDSDEVDVRIIESNEVRRSKGFMDVRRDLKEFEDKLSTNRSEPEKQATTCYLS